MLLGGLALGIVLVVLIGAFVTFRFLQTRAGASPVSLPPAPIAAGKPAAPKANALAGSCVIRAIVPGASKSCTDYFGGTSASFQELCEKFDIKGALSATWSDSGCVRTGAVYGCQAQTGSYTQWVYPPLSSRQKARQCPNDETLVQP